MVLDEGLTALNFEIDVLVCITGLLFLYLDRRVFLLFGVVLIDLILMVLQISLVDVKHHLVDGLNFLLPRWETQVQGVHALPADDANDGTNEHGDAKGSTIEITDDGIFLP